MQYVGLTEQHLHERMNGHRASVKAKKSTFLYDHFNQEGHSFDSATVQIIDVIDTDQVDDVRTHLSILELSWINLLSTAYPLGLNDNIKGKGNISISNMDDIYFQSTIKRYRRGHGTKSKEKNSETRSKEKERKRMEMSNNEVSDLVMTYKKDIEEKRYNDLYRRLSKMRKIETIQCGKQCLSNSNIGIVFNVIRSFCKSYSNPPKAKSLSESILFHFSSKAMDHLKLNSLFRDTRLCELLPQAVKELGPLKIYYKYDFPVGRRIFNYNKFLKGLVKEEMQTILEGDCDCNRSPYLYEPRRHVITGNLSFIEHDGLRQVMSYGTKYREPVHLPKDELLESLKESIDSFVSKITRKYKVRREIMTCWKEEMMSIFSNKVSFLERCKPHLFQKLDSILEKEDVKRYLNLIQKKYIICSIDKASNNYVFVCKKYYLTTLMSELGVDQNTLQCVGNNTYAPVVADEEQIVEDHRLFLHDTFNITVSTDNRCIPRIFWTPKLHKNPYKARYIAGASKSSTKQLSVYLNKALKVVKEYFSKYCGVVYRNTGINCDWSINSSRQFLDRLPRSGVFNIQVYDFTTLYTNLNLTTVESLLFEVFDLLYNNTNKYICVSRYNDKYFFSKKEYSGYVCFSIQKLKTAISFVLNNTYIYFGGFILRQTKGIPMGGNISSFVADISLCKCEFNFMTGLIKEKKFNLAKILSNNGRYVDDLNTQNYLHFESLIPRIYPPDLKMERAGDDNKDINYLDINITIDDRGDIRTDLYNKLNDFNFPVVMYNFPQGNMPLSVGYNVFYGQVLRYSNIISDLENFISATKQLYRILLRRGYDDEQLKRKFRGLIRGRPDVLHKYNVQDINDIQDLVFNI